MPQFALLATFVPGTGPQEGSEDHDREMEAWDQFNAAVEASGDLVWWLALEGTDAGAVVPAAQEAVTRPNVFAQYVMEVRDVEEAKGWARRMPVVDYGSVEVRPVLDHHVCTARPLDDRQGAAQ